MGAIFLTSFGRIASKQGKTEEALTSFIDAAAMAKEIGYPKQELISLYNCSSFYINQKDYENAITTLRNAEHLGRITNDLESLARVSFGLGSDLRKQKFLNLLLLTTKKHCRFMKILATEKKYWIFYLVWESHISRRTSLN